MLQLSAKTAVYEGAGCGQCHHNGYRSRFAVYEYIILDEALRREMADDPKQFARTQREKKALRAGALAAMKEGLTTADEVIKILHRDG
jgi:general secretion pathway protein E